MAKQPAPWLPGVQKGGPAIRSTAMTDLEAVLEFAQCDVGVNVTFMQAKRFATTTPKVIWRVGTLCRPHFTEHCGLIVTADPRFNIPTGTFGWHVQRGMFPTIILPKLLDFDVLHIVRIDPLDEAACWKCKKGTKAPPYG